MRLRLVAACLFPLELGRPHTATAPRARLHNGIRFPTKLRVLLIPAGGAWVRRLSCRCPSHTLITYVTTRKLSGTGISTRVTGPFPIVTTYVAVAIALKTTPARPHTRTHPQGVCRDLGLGWTEARLLPTSAAAPLENADSVPIHMDGIACFANRVWWARPWSEEREQPPSFLRDCRPDWRGSIIKTCDHRTDVVIACGGSGEPEWWWWGGVLDWGAQLRWLVGSWAGGLVG